MIRWKLPYMVGAVPDILARIVGQKKEELRQAHTPIRELENRAQTAKASRRSFRSALESKAIAIIAEIKQASPSRGTLAASFAPAEIARDYEAGGAAALSVLTDGQFFRGCLADLEIAREAVSLPALRKDFTIDEYHVYEAAAHGADAVLLIAAILGEPELRRFRELAASFGMDAIVEVHSPDELVKAAASGADIIGVNNRNLHTFEVAVSTSLDLAPRIPKGALAISESGIESRGQIQELQRAGYRAFLVGEYLMRSGDARAALQSLTS